MKRRIEQLLNGIFEYEQEKPVFGTEKIQIFGRPQEAVQGSFTIARESGKRVKGFLYSSSPRLKCSPVEFQGTLNEIQYQADLSGCEEGFSEEGCITVCSELGEHALPFEIRIREKDELILELPFADMQEFAQLAHEDFQVAYRWFLTKEFRALLEQEGSAYAALYDGLARAEFSYQSMEEFLSASGLKDSIRLTLSGEELVRDWLTEPVRETIVLTKNTWGFQKISVSSDAAFLRPERRMITTDEFAGSTFDLNFVIHTDQMHAGRNYARVTVETARQKLTFSVTAQKKDRRTAARSAHICKAMMQKLEALYVSYRLKKIEPETWIDRSLSAVSSYKSAGGKDPFADLFLVQLLYADGRKEKAYDILENFDDHRELLNTPERYGFYLYLTTFFYQEASYVDRVEAEIVKMFCQDKTNWKLLWILLYLQEEFVKNENRRFEAVQEQFHFGCRSRILYLEAYHLLEKNPFQLRRLGAFELALLRFAAREEVLTEELIRQCANLALHQNVYSEKLFEILETGYGLYPSEELICAICYLLIKGQKKGRRYFAWYEKGVEAGLRVTGLYEYYMEAMEECDISQLPQIIRRYFAYDSSLDYRKRAAIYRRMTENRTQDAQMFRQYRSIMERFAQDQLESGRISEDLAVLYQTFLKEHMLTRQSAGKLARLLFTYEVICEDPQYVQAIVYSPCMKGEHAKSLSDGKAKLRIYDPDSIVFLADAEGNRYTAESLCTVRRIFENEEMLGWCAGKAPDMPGIVLYLCVRCLKAGFVTHKTLPYFVTACEMEELTGSFRDRLRAEVLNYYLEHTAEPSLPDFLEQIPLLEYVKVDKTALITLLAEEGMCQKAFALLDTFGAEGIPILRLVRICSRMVIDLEFEENAMLLSLCHTCFSSGKYDDKLLRYLVLYYEGPVQEMKQVWHAAKKFELDTMLIEEKIMMMLLFTRSGTQGSEPVFEAYLRKLGRKRLCRAYVNLRSYEYVVRGMPVADSVFRYIEKDYLELSEQNRLLEQEEAARLALLQYYAGKPQTDPQRRVLIAKLLEEFGAKGMRFAFWKRFDAELLRPYQMEGRVFVEYVCHPEHTVTIFYRMRGSEEAYRKEAAENYFGGVFVKEFTLFAQEELECYLEEDDGQKVRRSDLRLLKADRLQPDSGTKFGILNRISDAQARQDEDAVWENIESWMTLEHLVQEVFTLV